MKDPTHLLNRSSISFSPIPNAIKVDNPAAGEALVFVRKTDSDGLKLLIQKAEAIQKLWAAKTMLERAGVLWRWYFLMKKNKEELARIMTMEQGKNLIKARGETDYMAPFVRWSTKEARRIDGDVLTNMKAPQELVVSEQPIGTTAAITPWNFPSAMTTRRTAPASTVGRATVAKPAPLTPSSAHTLVVLTYEAGAPQDLLPVVNGSTSETSHEFATNPTARKISFTGSTEVDAKIFADNVADIKKLNLELGGNASFTVFDDAGLDKTVEGAPVNKFRNSGQTCVYTNRVYAQSGICDEFCRGSSEKMAALKLGSGPEKGVNQGPLIKKKAVEKIEQYIIDTPTKGANCLVGGKRGALDGTLFKPTVLSGVMTHMAVVREKTLGSLHPVFRSETEAEAIVAANNTEYGLAAYLFTSGTARQWCVGEALEYGAVDISTSLINSEVVPFGSVKRSGLGREGNKCGTDEYLGLKYLCIDVAE